MGYVDCDDIPAHEKDSGRMSTRPDSVTTALELRLVVPGNPSLPVMAELTYEHNDPYAIKVAFHTGGTDVV